MLTVSEHLKVSVLGRVVAFLTKLLDEQTLHVLHHHDELVDVLTRDNLAIIAPCNRHHLFESIDLFVFEGHLLIVVPATSIVHRIFKVSTDLKFLVFNILDVVKDLSECHHDVLSLRR